MQPFSIHTKLTLADWRAMQRVCALRVQQQDKWVKSWPVVGVWVLIGLVSAVLLPALELKLQAISIGLGIAFCVALILVAHKRSLRLAQPGEGGPFLSSAVCEFSAEGITSIQQGARSFSQWS